MSKLNFIDYMSGGTLLTVVVVMGYYAQDTYKRIAPVESHNILQIKELSDLDEKQGLDTIILEDGRRLQIEEKNNKLDILEK